MVLVLKVDEFGNKLECVEIDKVRHLIMPGYSVDQRKDRLTVGISGSSKDRRLSGQEAAMLFFASPELVSC